MHNLHPIGLTRSEEPNHLHVHDSYLLQVQNQPRSVILELVVQFPDVVRLKMTTQVNRGHSALRGLFDLHVPVTLIETSASALVQALCQRRSTELTGFWPRETAELSGILIFRKRVTNHRCGAPVLRNGGEDNPTGGTLWLT